MPHESNNFDWSSAELAEGLECYRRKEFFEAHEHWESVWLILIEPEKSFLQALIQISAAMHHFQKSNSAGAASLLRRSHRRLSQCPPVFGGIHADQLREEVAACIKAMHGGSSARDISPPNIRPIVSRLE